MERGVWKRWLWLKGRDQSVVRLVLGAGGRWEELLLSGSVVLVVVVVVVVGSVCSERFDCVFDCDCGCSSSFCAFCAFCVVLVSSVVVVSLAESLVIALVISLVLSLTV